MHRSFPGVREREGERERERERENALWAEGSTYARAKRHGSGRQRMQGGCVRWDVFRGVAGTFAAVRGTCMTGGDLGALNQGLNQEHDMVRWVVLAAAGRR